MSKVESWCGSGELPCNNGPDYPCDVCALLAENERLREALEGATAFRSIAAMKAADEALRRSRAAAVPEERE